VNKEFIVGGPRLKQNEVFVALTACTGNVAAAARRLGATRSGLWFFIERHPRLLQLTKDFRESIVDNAESAFNKAVVTEQPWAIQFALRTIGRKRGYVDRQEIQQETRVTISQPAEELTDEQLARIAARASGATGSGGGASAAEAGPPELG
jgi:hypothetical protein